MSHMNWETILKQNLLKHPSYYSRDKIYKQEHRNTYFVDKNRGIIIKQTIKPRTIDWTKLVISPEINLRRRFVEVIYRSDHLKERSLKISWDQIKEIDIFIQKSSN